MKRSIFLNSLLAISLILGGAVGCKLKPKSPTPISSRPTGGRTSPTPFPPTGANDTGPRVVPVDDSRSRPVPTPSDNPDRTFDLTPVEGLPTTENRDLFAANTVYFDFDRSTIKASERSKVEAVSKHLLANPTHGVKIEGHCDERGTEGYNLSLGERRALAIREYLVNLGVPADKVTTISFGEARPAETGHDESAWRKNRRGEFILLTP